MTVLIPIFRFYRFFRRYCLLFALILTTNIRFCKNGRNWEAEQWLLASSASPCSPLISSTATSGLYYYRYMIKNENPEYYYPICLAAVFLTALFASLMARQYLDWTPSLRCFILITTFKSILGNKFISFHFRNGCQFLEKL